MKLPALFGAAALLAGCATAGEGPPTAAWLVGSWLRIAEGVEFPMHCDTGLPIHYLPDGTWRIFEGDGTWRLEGHRLIETVRDTASDDVPIGVPSSSRIVRVGPDEYRETGPDGVVATFRRCPPEP